MKHFRHKRKSFRIDVLSKKLASSLRHLHCSLGVFSAIFIITIAATGLLINHSHDIAADTTNVKQAWLLDYYGIQPPSDITIYQQTPVSLASTDNIIWIDQQLSLETNARTKGIITYKDLLLAVDSHHLYMLSNKGELLEQQDASWGLPQGIETIGSNDNVWLKTPEGHYVGNHDLTAWHRAEPSATIEWSAALSKNAHIEKEHKILALHARSSHLTWERVLLDVHSGRFFGKAGPWFMDFIAVALIIMVLSGMYLWWKKKPKRREITHPISQETNAHTFTLKHEKQR